MSPVSVGTSRFTSALQTGSAKLWILLVGVNEYRDENLPSLRYSAVDCQGLGQALFEATQAFPQKEVIVHHDFAAQTPKLETVLASLKHIVTAAHSQDTVLFYFSGHGVLEVDNQQTVLCLADTQKDNLLKTGLSLQELLQMLSNCAADRQLIWLDACHSGDMRLWGARGNASETTTLFQPIPQMLEALRRRAQDSKGLYALLSCDQGQQSWEFPDLGHGLFTYFLMQGLRGEAAGHQGVIDADGLYRYVYHQTLQYIEKTNQQIRLVNQQKRSRGDAHLHPEYPLQTPKRIVEGVGELVLGLKPDSVKPGHQRRALVVEGCSGSQTTLALSEVLRTSGNFELETWPRRGLQTSLPENGEKQPSQKLWLEVREAIQTHLRKSCVSQQELSADFSTPQEIATLLLYLRGRIEETQEGEACLVLNNGVRISRSWLRQELRFSKRAQQIIVLDCPGASSLADWVEELKLGSEQGQCLVAAAAPEEEPELFAQVLIESLVAANQQAGLSVAGWIAKLQANLAGMEIALHIWLSGTQGVIEVIPAKRISSTAQKVQKPEPSSLRTQALVQTTNRVRQTFSQDHGKQPKPHLSSPASSDRNFPQPDLQQRETTAPLESRPPILASEQYARLEKILIDLIGPVAPTILRKLAKKSPTSRALLESLKLLLTPNQLLEFENQTIFLRQNSTVQPQVQHQSLQPRNKSHSLPKWKEEIIDETFVQQCQQNLANLIGPIATFIVQKTLASHPTISSPAFVETLAAAIPDPEKAREFKLKTTEYSSRSGV